MTTTTTGFDEHALARLPSPAPFLDAIRAQAFEAFEALPIPVAGDRGVALHGPGGLRVRPAAVRRGRPRREPGPGPEEILAAAGQVGERAGLADPAELRGDGHPSRPRARRQGGAGSATSTARSPSAPTSSSPTCTPSSRPTARSSPPCTPRSAPAGRSCTCRPASRSSCRCRR